MDAVQNKTGRHSHRRSRKEWTALIQRCESGGSGVTAFCRREAVSTASYYLWRKRLRQEGAAPSAPDIPTTVDSSAPTFLELGQLPGQAGWELELDLGGGVVVRLKRH